LRGAQFSAYVQSLGTIPRPAIHPGEILAEELIASPITPAELARQLNVPPNRATQIVNGKRAIMGDMPLRLGHWFGMNPHFLA
jgi:antitoxin HigA-1